MLMPKLENFCLDIKINDDGVFQNTFIEKLLIKTIDLSKPFFLWDWRLIQYKI